MVNGSVRTIIAHPCTTTGGGQGTRYDEGVETRGEKYVDARCMAGGNRLNLHLDRNSGSNVANWVAVEPPEAVEGSPGSHVVITGLTDKEFSASCKNPDAHPKPTKKLQAQFPSLRASCDVIFPAVLCTSTNTEDRQAHDTEIDEIDKMESVDFESQNKTRA